MKNFQYTIQAPVGIHARPATQLVKEAASHGSAIRLVKDGRKADAKSLLAVMSLGVKCGETVSFEIEGDDEEKAYRSLSAFCNSSL